MRTKGWVIKDAAGTRPYVTEIARNSFNYGTRKEARVFLTRGEALSVCKARNEKHGNLGLTKVFRITARRKK